MAVRKAKSSGDVEATPLPLCSRTMEAGSFETSLGGLLDAAMQIAAERNSVLHSMRAALEIGDNETALHHARRLCGVHDKAGH